jgi:hypothetical protein
LLATREHHILDYHVFASAPPLWGFIALPAWKLLAILLAGAALAGACVRLSPGDATSKPCRRPVRWLLAAYLIPAADALRALGLPIALTFFEPLLLTSIPSTSPALVRAPV